MKLFEFKNWKLTVSEEAWGLLPFKKILDRDKTKEKENALKEMLFIFFWSDIRSNYINMPDSQKLEEIKKDVGLSSKWKKDSVINEAITLYEKLGQSVIETLYKQSLKGAQAVGNYLENSEALLYERDNNGKPVNDISKITTALQKVPNLMKDLKNAYKEVVREREDNDNKKKGSKQFNTFEDGLTL